MTVVTETNNNEGQQKTRALLPPEGGAAAPPQQQQQQPTNTTMADDEDEGYIVQKPSNPPPSTTTTQPSHTTTSAVDDDEEGYIQQKPQPAATTTTTTTALATTTNSNNNTQPISATTATTISTAPTGDASQNPTATKAPKPDQWQTMMVYDESVDTKECLFGGFCFHCAQAKAKSDLDGTSVAYNCLCWHHGMTYSWLRSVYGIKSNCGSDVMSAVFCACCSGRRILSEVRIRGPRLSTEKEREEWTEDIFGCSTCSFIQACVFPCCVGHDVRVKLHGKDDLDCCFDFMCLNPCAMYGQVRNQYKLPAQFLPPAAEDICLACWMYPCALNQAKRELEIIKGK